MQKILNFCFLQKWIEDRLESCICQLHSKGLTRSVLKMNPKTHEFFKNVLFFPLKKSIHCILKADLNILATKCL